MTFAWFASMFSMSGMPMPGGWTMSMAWMRMPGQSWAAAAASFLAMWVVMMVAMMLPSLVPMLMRYRRAVAMADAGGAASLPRPVTCEARRERLPMPGNVRLGLLTMPGSVQLRLPAMPGAVRLALLTTQVSIAYFLIWTALGVIVFPLGAALAAVTMQVPALARAVPLATGVVVTIAGALQFTQWKARQLACCRAEPACGCVLAADFRTAWRHGLQLGRHCARCCSGMTAVLLVVGVMDISAMAVVTAAITLERLAPSAERVARGIGVCAIATGLLFMARAWSSP